MTPIRSRRACRARTQLESNLLFPEPSPCFRQGISAGHTSRAVIGRTGKRQTAKSRTRHFWLGEGERHSAPSRVRPFSAGPRPGFFSNRTCAADFTAFDREIIFRIEDESTMPASLSVSASRPGVKHPAESILFGVDFTPLLASGELLSGVSAIGATPAGLTIGSEAVNSTEFDNDVGGTVPIGQGARFRAAGGVADVDYALTVTATTTAGNIRVVVCSLQVRES
jgi:hypothetical protein